MKQGAEGVSRVGGLKHALNGVGPRLVTREARAGGGQKRERQSKKRRNPERATHARIPIWDVVGVVSNGAGFS